MDPVDAPSHRIRTATEDDAAAIARCYRSAYATAAELGYRSRLTDVTAETVASWLDDDAVTLVAEHDGVLGERDDVVSEGDGVLGTIRLVEKDSVPTVERLAVVPRYQRNGVATRLLERAESLARRQGEGRLRLTTFADHPFLLEWYERRGYEPIDCPHPNSWTLDEFALLEKSLET